MITFLKWGMVLVGVYFLMRGCSDVIDPSKVGSSMNGQWEKLETISGYGDQVSSAYTVPTGKARVKWYAHNSEKRPGTFAVRAKNSTTGALVNDISSVTVGAGGTRSGERAFQKAQTFYLEVQSTMPWEITIEVMQ